METVHRIEVIDKLLTVCRAGRAGRRLDLVPAFAAEESRLLDLRAQLAASLPANMGDFSTGATGATAKAA